MNDDALEMDPDAIGESLTVTLLADLFDVSTDRVAKDVLRARKKEAKAS